MGRLFAAAEYQPQVARLSQKVESLEEGIPDQMKAVSADVFRGLRGDQERSLESLIEPIHRTLEQTRNQMESVEKNRHAGESSMKEIVNGLIMTQKDLAAETNKLVGALKSSDSRGQWGEVKLRRIVELAGMTKHVDFTEQNSLETEEGRMRPDMIVRLPEDREIVIDSKAPFNGFIAAMDAKNESERRVAVAHHAKLCKDRVRELASKAYWTQFKKSPDFVVLFFPGDQILNLALEGDPDLIDFGMQNKVVIVTPGTLIALLKVVSYSWRQQSVAENAEKIRVLGEELYGRVGVFLNHMETVRKGLNSAVKGFNSSVGSLECQSMPSVRKFKELGIETKKEINDPEPPLSLS